MKNNSIGKDLTEGNILRIIITFAMPLFLGNILQLILQMINAFWIGRFLGTEAFSAVTMTYPIVFIMFSLVIGVSIAATALVSQHKGAGNNDMISKIIDNSFVLTFLISVVLTILGFVFNKSIISLAVNPTKMPEVFNLACGYLNVTLAGLVFMFGFNLISAILRGLGDSWTPLKFLSMAVILNLVLDPLLILGLGFFPKMGINGSALATIIAQVFSFIFALNLLRKQGVLNIRDFKGFKFDTKLVKSLLMIGLPSGIQQVIVSTGVFIIAKMVSDFGITTISVFGIGSRLDSFCFLPSMAIGMSVTALTGQNLGAGKKERVSETVKIGALFSILITSFIVILCYAFPKQIILFFLSNPSIPQDQLNLIIAEGTAYLKIVSIGYFGVSTIFVTNGALQGAGDTIPPMIFAILSFWLFRIPLSWFLSQHTGLQSSGIWLGITIGFIISAILSFLYFRFGPWEKKVIISR
ncbi:MAG: MATE family efflux transporter [Ignavibacteriales bacterium]